MLNKNPIYQIYKNGKVPVIRFKNDGFKNFIQDEYFKDPDGNIKPEKKNINGCFCIIGGMQDSFILSGVNDIEILNIGYIEPDEKVFIPWMGKFVKAKDILDEGMKQYKKIEHQEKKNRPNPSEYEFEYPFDDFDLVTTQAIVNADNVKDIKTYDANGRMDLIHTMNDGFFQVGNILDFLEPAIKTKRYDEYLKFAEEQGVLNKLLNSLAKDMPKELLGRYKVVDRFYELYQKYDTKDYLFDFHEKLEQIQILEKHAPKSLYEDVSKFDKIEEILDKKEVCGTPGYYYNCSAFVRIDDRPIPVRMMVRDGKFEFTLECGKGSERIENFLDSDIVLNKTIVSTIAEEFKKLEFVSQIDKDAVIDDKNMTNTFIKLDEFYKTYPDVEISEDGIRYLMDNFNIEYNLKLDDCIIECKLPGYEDKLFHEEDLILAFDNKNVLDIIYDFRKCINSTLEKDEIMK